MSNNPTISLCMIVKNEEKVLDRCLRSVEEFVDEIIIVDTGSTDRTKEIASAHGAKLFDFRWNNDFSAARNFAREKASMEWILQLDGDEYFETGKAAAIKESLVFTPTLGLKISIFNVSDRDKHGLTHIYPRIFKNIPEISYHNKIHEQLLYNGRDIIWGDSDIAITHTGYTSETVKEKNKSERNIRLIKDELKNNPNNGFMNYNLATEYMLNKNYKDAIKHLKIAFQNSKQKNNDLMPFILYGLGRTMILTKDYEGALTILKNAKIAYPDYTDLFFLEGEALENTGRIQDAKSSYRECLNMGEASARYLTTRGVGTSFPKMRLASIDIRERSLFSAIESLSSLLNEDPANENVLRSLVSILRLESSDEEIFKFLERFYDESDAAHAVIKFNLAFHFRMIKPYMSLYKSIKSQGATMDPSYDFYFSLYNNDFEDCLKLLREMDKKNGNFHKFAFLSYFRSQNEDFKPFLEGHKTSNLLISILKGHADDIKKLNYDNDFYIGALKEMVLCKDYAAFELLLDCRRYFNDNVLKNIGDIFHDNFNDDLAMEFYAKYLETNGKDAKTFALLSEIAFAQGLYEEAISIAENARKLNSNDFRTLEIIIESLKKLKQISSAEDLSKRLLAVCPDSNYLINNSK